MSLAVVALVLLAGVVAVSAARKTLAGRLAFLVIRRATFFMLRILAGVVPLPSWLVRALGAAYGDRAELAICDGCGEAVSLVGLMTCSCGHTSVRRVFAPCIACGVALRFVGCPHCGQAVMRPAWFTQGYEPRRYR